MTRRDMLRGAATGLAAAGLPTWFTSEAEAAVHEGVLAMPRTLGPNDTIQIGLIGPGGSRGGYRQGLGDARWAHGIPGAKVVSVCDVDAVHRREAAAVFGPCTTQHNHFRDILANQAMDAVPIGTPDHWHAQICLAAMKAGKDIYCEKPLTLTIGEGREIVKLQKRTKRVFQVGSQQRSDGRFRLACQVVRAGRIGKLKMVETHLPGGPAAGPFATKPVPEGLDWNMWLGPAPMTDYIPERTHGSFRWWLEYSGGMLTDWGAHHNDIAQWGIGADGSGPLSVEASGTPPSGIGSKFYNTFPEYEVFYEYPNDVKIHCTNKGENGVKFIGESGWVFVSRGRIEASDPRILEEALPADADRLYVSDNHMKNWLDCIRSRKTPICSAEVGHRSVSVCHLANISLRLNGRKLMWDAKNEQVIGDGQANAMVSKPDRDWTKA